MHDIPYFLPYLVICFISHTDQLSPIKKETFFVTYTLPLTVCISKLVRVRMQAQAWYSTPRAKRIKGFFSLGVMVFPNIWSATQIHTHQATTDSYQQLLPKHVQSANGIFQTAAYGAIPLVTSQRNTFREKVLPTLLCIHELVSLWLTQESMPSLFEHTNYGISNLLLHHTGGYICNVCINKFTWCLKILANI